MSKKQQDAQSELNALAAQSADSIANLQHELQGQNCSLSSGQCVSS